MTLTAHYSPLQSCIISTSNSALRFLSFLVSNTLSVTGHTPSRQPSVRAATMPGRQQYLSFSIKLVCGTLVLLLLAATLQHSSEVLVSSVNTVHGIATQSYHNPAPTKVGIPFGNKNHVQAIDRLNATSSVHEPYLSLNANELKRRVFTW